MTEYIVLDNMVWIQRLTGDEPGSSVIDTIKKKCDSIIVNDEILDAYSRTLQMHYPFIPPYLSRLLLTELLVLQKAVSPEVPQVDLKDVHRKDGYLVKAARPYHGVLITEDNGDLLTKRHLIELNHKVKVLTPKEYKATKAE